MLTRARSNITAGAVQTYREQQELIVALRLFEGALYSRLVLCAHAKQAADVVSDRCCNDNDDDSMKDRLANLGCGHLLQGCKTYSHRGCIGGLKRVYMESKRGSKGGS